MDYLSYAKSLHKTATLNGSVDWKAITQEVFQKYPDVEKCSPNALRNRVARTKDKTKEIEESFPDWPEYNASLKYCDKITKDWEKVLVVGDLHFPTMNVKEYQRMIISHEDADAMVLLGDGPDTDKLSYWGAQRRLALKDELMGFRSILAWTQKFIPEIYWIEGNHEFRAKKMWETSIPEDMKLIAKPPSIAEFVTNPAPFLDKDIPKLNNIEYLDHFQIIINNVLFTHPSQVRKTPLGVAVERFLGMWKAGYEIDGLLYNHTHFADGVKIVDGHFSPTLVRNSIMDIKETKSLLTQIEKLLAIQKDMLLIENGCMCYLQQYAKESRKYMHRPYINGYSILFFNNHILDIENSYFVEVSREGS